MSEQDNANHEQGEPTRRDFLYLTTGMAAAVGAAGVAWPFINQMNPDAATRAAGEPVEVDVSSLEPGAEIKVVWRGKPYSVRRLTPEQVDSASALTESDMKDYAPIDTRLGGPEGGTQDWVIVASNCTHLGCVPNVVDGTTEGWFCPCHGSSFDTTGRILSGPAPINLPNPPYVFASETTLVIGTDAA